MEFYFHVNPPSQRGKKREKKSRASFCGIVTTSVDGTVTTLQIGMSFCHSVDQFCRRTGRIKSKGNAMSQRHRSYDLSEIPEKDYNDRFVQICRSICDNYHMEHNYTRRKRGQKTNKMVAV